MISAIKATITITSKELAYTISDKIASSNSFTTVTDMRPEKMSTKAIGLIRLSSYWGDISKITHICLLTKGRRVATGQCIVKASHITEMPEFEIEELERLLPSKFRNAFKKIFTDSYAAVSPKLGEAIASAIVEMFPDFEPVISALTKLQRKTTVHPDTNRNKIAALEKDALSLALGIFGEKAFEISGSWSENKFFSGNSFMSGFDSYRVYEDDIIAHDLYTFPRFEKASNVNFGIVEFINEHNEKLVVINANRKPLEKTLGVDLIYFNKKYLSFTFIQYKMMDRVDGNGNAYYNPNNKSHNTEILRMHKWEKRFGANQLSRGIVDYRLTDSALYFKLCKNTSLRTDGMKVSLGAYISLPHWSLLLDDPNMKGSKGGCQLGFHTLGRRYIGTDLFVELVRDGFIGTRSQLEEDLSTYINDLLTKGHSVLFAEDHSK